MGKLTLILGGARSGKSDYGLKMALDGAYRQVLFVATAQAFDHEMEDRIAVHQAERPDRWQTLEAPTNVGLAIEQATHGKHVDCVLLDCLTMLASNVLLALGDDTKTGSHQAEAALNAEIEAILSAHQSADYEMIIISNEVGLGLVPPYPLGRIYRDALGRANQRLAAKADQVFFMVAGLPLALK